MRPITDNSTQPAELLPVFQRLLPTSALVAIVANAPGKFYQRVFTPLVVLWGFVHQQMGENRSCDSVLGFLGNGGLDEWDAATRAAGAGRRLKYSGPLSGRVPKQNSSYCQGRARLPLQVLRGALALSARTIHQEVTAARSPQAATSAAERPVLLVDGSTLLLQAQPALREHYGCHGNQNGPGHWPVLRMVAAFDLFTGALMSVTEGTLQESEQALAVRGMGELATAAVLPAAPIYVGDRNFGVFGQVHGAVHYGGDVLVRLTASRFKACLDRAGVQGNLQSGEERAVAWHPSRHDKVLIRPQAGNEEQDAGADEACAAEPVTGRFIYWRLERDGYRPVELHLFTTLMDEQLYPAQALVDLYGQRWHVELNLRHVKVALGLGQLQARSVEMARKELLAGCLCYNLIRGLMALAAIKIQLSPLDLSFKRCWIRIQFMAQTWPQNATAQKTEARCAQLMKIMGHCTLYRSKKQRVQQRAVRKRPCPFPVLVGERTSSLVLSKS
jgi:Transposase DDE domain